MNSVSFLAYSKEQVSPNSYILFLKPILSMSNLTNRKKILMIGTAVIVAILSGFPTNTSLIAVAQEEQDIDVAPALSVPPNPNYCYQT